MTLKLSLLAAILSVGFVSGQDSTAQFKMNTVTVKTVAGLPDGNVVADVTIYEPGKDPYVTIHVEGTLSHSLPGVPRLGR
ncbi:hypothetical protein G9C98_000295 [Cotesia typhae]|uniref:Uncharacterized protein n=1 Tax=Cotesia typhae TaxID=2053667 RepID=A0A8J5R119_9HYME|nr:hypothetical protein G9C98_000295 [Cotesia typhae]